MHRSGARDGDVFTEGKAFGFEANAHLVVALSVGKVEIPFATRLPAEEAYTILPTGRELPSRQTD
jgi:hypothetical protein